jgi:hypothetical protein
LFPRAPDGDAPKVSNELRKAARLAGLAPDRANRISPYDLRHGRATEFVHNTDLLSTSYLIGHKHASTTDRYIHGRKEMAVLALAKLAAGAALKPAPNPPKHDFGHTLATLDVLPESAAQPAAANSADSHQCEEQDLNLHTLRHRNLKRQIGALKHWDCSIPDRQERSGMDRNRPISDTGVATGCDEVERALVDALVARRLGDVVGVRRALLRALQALE